MQAGKTNKTTHCVLFQLNAPMEFATCKSQVSCRATREALHKVSGSREALHKVSVHDEDGQHARTEVASHLTSFGSSEKSENGVSFKAD